MHQTLQDLHGIVEVPLMEIFSMFHETRYGI